jgi:uncharacterized protein YjiS (DUF1127 family)
MTMKAMNTGHKAPTSVFAGSEKASFIRQFVTAITIWQERASMRTKLAQLDKDNLTDMGMTLADVKLEINKPFWQH